MSRSTPHTHPKTCTGRHCRDCTPPNVNPALTVKIICNNVYGKAAK